MSEMELKEHQELSLMNGIICIRLSFITKILLRIQL